MADSIDVVVVGGGIAGSAMATVLARAGLPVLVLERAVRCRLIVGADGRGSVVRQQAGISLSADEPHHLFAGLLVEDLDWPDDLQTIGTEGDVHFFVFPQGARKARLYLGHALSQRQRFAGPEGATEFLRAFDVKCVP